MRFITTLCLILLSWIYSLSFVQAAMTPDLNLREPTIATKGAGTDTLDTFVGGFREFFFLPDFRDESIMNTFISIAFAIKNFFIAVAVLFLIVGVLKLLFS